MLFSPLSFSHASHAQSEATDAQLISANVFSYSSDIYWPHAARVREKRMFEPHAKSNPNYN